MSHLTTEVLSSIVVIGLGLPVHQYDNQNGEQVKSREQGRGWSLPSIHHHLQPPPHPIWSPGQQAEPAL